MANNYYDVTGVLVLDRVTPVITALFGAFNLDATYPGDGQAYIACIAETNNPQWGDVFDGLEELAAQLGLPLPDNERRSIALLLDLFAAHFGVKQDQALAHLITHHDFDADVDLESLLLIATCFDDGHHLTAIQYEGCWHCSKPRLFEFGGNGYYLSREIRVSRSSSQAIELGVQLHKAILVGDFNAAAVLIAQQTQDLLAGIQDEHIRMRVVQRVASRLLASLSIPDAT